MSNTGRTILFAAIISISIGAAYSQTPSRNFRMALWNNPTGADADLPIFTENEAQPKGESVLVVFSWQRNGFAEYWLATLAHKYDLRRLQAVLIDEPYWNATGENWSNPCRDKRNIDIVKVNSQLRTIAGLVHETARNAKFWINFSEPEMRWMMDTGCPAELNQSYIDVVSLDVYWKPFDAEPHSYYNWLMSHLAGPGQKIALIPGTFVRKGVDKPHEQAALLKGYFDYANGMNAQCRQSGKRSKNRCPVWLVAGWLATGFNNKAAHWAGLQDPESAEIRSAWASELAKPVRIANSR